jgi:predicted MPP superfamily phosphohydrolase
LRLKIRARAVALIAICTLGTVVVVDALFIEPGWVEVTHHRVSGRLAQPLRIVHLTDLHTYGPGRVEREVLSLVAAERPDLIVITGDLISSIDAYEGCREVLRGLHAPLGVWVVRGNHEIWAPVKNERGYFKSEGATLLVNESIEVAEGVWIAGFDDAFAGSPDLARTLANIPQDAFKVALFHSPEFFDRVAGSCDVALAGHTHGGQVRLPLLNPFWLPPSCGRYVDGWYEQKGSRMYVSRGIGTSIAPVRFLCRPEIAVITLEPY